VFAADRLAVNLPKRLLVELIAALAAQAPPRKPGIHAYVPAIMVLGPVLGLPIFLLLVAVLTLITFTHPGRQLPLIDFALMAGCSGIVVVDEMVRRWRAPIEARLAAYDALDAAARGSLRARILATGAAAAALMLALFVFLMRA
jgi:hypothetical protein